MCQASTSHSSSAIIPVARAPVSHSHWPRSPAGASSASTVASARSSSGAAAACPSPSRSASASSTTSTGPGGSGAGGAARAASAASSSAPGLLEVSGPDRRAERLEVRRARELGIERLQAPGRAAEQPRGVADAALVERDVAAQVLGLRRLQLGHRPGLGRGHEVLGVLERAGVALGVRGREQPAHALGRLGRERRGALEEGGGRGDAAARLRPRGGALELLGHRLVGTGGRLGAVPCAPVGMGRRRRWPRRAPRAAHGARRRRPSDTPPSARAGGGSGPGRGSPAGPPRRPASRRPDRMPSRPAARHSSSGSPTGSAAASCTSRSVSGGRASSRRRKPSSIPADSPSDAGTAKPPASSAALIPRGSSSSASGLPWVSSMIRSRTPSSIRPGIDRLEQRAGVGLVEPPQRRAPAGRTAGARRSAPARRARAPPTPREAGARRIRSPARSRRRATGSRRRRRTAAAPRRWRTSARAWPARRGSGREGRPAPGRARPEGDLLGLGKRVQPVEHRRAQLVQPRVRQLHLRLDARDLDDPEAGRPVAGVAQQRRLADARPRRGSTSTALCPPRTFSSSRSSCACSSDRPCSFGRRSAVIPARA